MVDFNFSSIRNELSIPFNKWRFFELTLKEFPAIFSLQIKMSNFNGENPSSWHFDLHFWLLLVAFLPKNIQSDLTGTGLIKKQLKLSQLGLIDSEIATAIDHTTELFSLIAQTNAFVWKLVVHSYTFVEVDFLHFLRYISILCIIFDNPTLILRMVI